MYACVGLASSSGKVKLEFLHFNCKSKFPLFYTKGREEGRWLMMGHFGRNHYCTGLKWRKWIFPVPPSEWRDSSHFSRALPRDPGKEQMHYLSPDLLLSTSHYLEGSRPIFVSYCPVHWGHGGERPKNDSGTKERRNENIGEWNGNIMQLVPRKVSFPFENLKEEEFPFRGKMYYP